MTKINHSKLNRNRKAKKCIADQKSKSFARKRLKKIKKDLATDPQKKYMNVLGIKYTSKTTLREALEWIRSKLDEIERTKKQDAAIPTLD